MSRPLRTVGPSPLSRPCPATPSSASNSAPEPPEPGSPEKTTKPADGPAPASPGAGEVRAATGLVQTLAQQESKLKREYERDQRVADKRWERSLESSAASNKAVQHHKTKNEIGKLSRRALKCLEGYEAARAEALISQVAMLKVSVAKQEARVLVRQAKLRSLRRRLRKRRLFGFTRW